VLTGSPRSPAQTAVILPVDAGATAEAGSMLPKEAMTNPGGQSDMPS